MCTDQSLWKWRWMWCECKLYNGRTRNKKVCLDLCLKHIVPKGALQNLVPTSRKIRKKYIQHHALTPPLIKGTSPTSHSTIPGHLDSTFFMTWIDIWALQILIDGHDQVFFNVKFTLWRKAYAWRCNQNDEKHPWSSISFVSNVLTLHSFVLVLDIIIIIKLFVYYSNFRCDCKDGYRGDGTTCYGNILQVLNLFNSHVNIFFLKCRSAHSSSFAVSK